MFQRQKTQVKRIEERGLVAFSTRCSANNLHPSLQMSLDPPPLRCFEVFSQRKISYMMHCSIPLASNRKSFVDTQGSHITQSSLCKVYYKNFTLASTFNVRRCIPNLGKSDALLDLWLHFVKLNKINKFQTVQENFPGCNMNHRSI